MSRSSWPLALLLIACGGTEYDPAEEPTKEWAPRYEVNPPIPPEPVMKLNMLTASTDSMACRIFIGCDDTANEFAAWLQMNGWHVRFEDDKVDPHTRPRIKEEEDLAAALTAEYEKWLATR